MSLSAPPPPSMPNPMTQASHKMLLWIGFALAVLAGLAVLSFAKHQSAAAPFCQSMGKPFAYTLCEFHPRQATTKLQLVWRYQNSNQVVLNFANLKHLIGHSQTLEFAMNAGMYDANYAPIGYTVINGQQVRSLNLKSGGGNFHLMPNGVFWWDAKGYHVTESSAMAKLLASGTKPQFATQSGPMLVINGQIHPSFSAQSSSQKLRNGVGVCQDGRVKFVISDTWVSFHQFAQLFRDTLGCDNALFLDGGRASALYSRELNRLDTKPMGVMLAATTAH